MTLDEQIAEMRAKARAKWMPKYEAVEQIQAAAIAVFDVEKESFFNGERTRAVSNARMASMALCRMRTKLPLNTIAKLHGGLDHSSVSYAVRQAQYGKADFGEAIEQIVKLLDTLETATA